MQLIDKVIIVTGSTTGIGEAIARRCVAEGARVLVHGRDRARGEQLVEDLGEAAHLHVDDVADAESPARIVATAKDHFGRIDGLVNNAAWIIRSNIESTDAELFDRCMAINARAPLLMIKAALPHLRESEGSIVNIGSINAYTGEGRQLAYSMSKGALMTLSRHMADVLAPERVRVNHFNVGWVLSPNEYQLKMTEGLPENWHLDPDPHAVPSGKMTAPEDIAAHAVFWLSNASRPVTGSVLELEQFPIIGRLSMKEGS